jgi:hypothetical protein
MFSNPKLFHNFAVRLLNKTPMILRFFPVAAFLLLLISSCTKDSASNVNQDRIYQDLEVFYDKNTDKTTVLAKFKFGGATGTFLELDSGATVKFNNDLLPYNSFWYGHYKEYAGRINSGTFTYKNIAGTIFTNAVPPTDSIAFPTVLDTIMKSQAFDLQWAGSPLIADEFVGLFIGSWTWGQNAAYLQTGDAATNLVLGTGQLSGVPVGTSTCYMDRSILKPLLQKTSVGGTVKTTFRARNKVIQIVN